MKIRNGLKHKNEPVWKHNDESLILFPLASTLCLNTFNKFDLNDYSFIPFSSVKFNVLSSLISSESHICKT